MIHSFDDVTFTEQVSRTIGGGDTPLPPFLLPDLGHIEHWATLWAQKILYKVLISCKNVLPMKVIPFTFEWNHHQWTFSTFRSSTVCIDPWAMCLCHPTHSNHETWKNIKSSKSNNQSFLSSTVGGRQLGSAAIKVDHPIWPTSNAFRA